MLVLTRRPTQALTIETKDGDIQIAIKGMSGDRVRLALLLPRTANVYRNELRGGDAGMRMPEDRDRQEGDREEGEDLPSQERGASEDPGASL